MVKYWFNLIFCVTILNQYVKNPYQYIFWPTKGSGGLVENGPEGLFFNYFQLFLKFETAM